MDKILFNFNYFFLKRVGFILNLNLNLFYLILISNRFIKWVINKAEKKVLRTSVL